jgi:hypothetical protein
LFLFTLTQPENPASYPSFKSIRRIESSLSKLVLSTKPAVPTMLKQYLLLVVPLLSLSLRAYPNHIHDRDIFLVPAAGKRSSSTTVYKTERVRTVVIEGNGVTEYCTLFLASNRVDGIAPIPRKYLQRQRNKKRYIDAE